MFRTPLVRHGSLEVVCGPMFSGKSEELIRRVRRAEIAGLRSLIVKPAVDDRYDVGHVVSHGGAKMRAVTAATSADVAPLAAGYEAVGIDEAQFFDDGIVGAVACLVDSGARVAVAGLAQDFRGLPFGAMPTLLALADHVDKLEAVCHRCGGPATLTQRLVDGRPAPFSGETVQIGARDSYEARCRACYEASPEDSARKTA
jgi:thymidine kinase